MSQQSLRCLDVALGLAQGRNCPADDLKRQVWQVQSVGQLLENALAVVTGVEKPSVLVRKDECLGGRIRTLCFPGKEIGDQHRRQMNRRKTLFVFPKGRILPLYTVSRRTSREF